MQPVKLTDAEKTRRLAEGCMGWAWDTSTRLWMAEEDGEICNAEDEYWQPIHNESDAAEVRQRMVELGWLCVQVAGVNRLHSASLSKDREYCDVVGAKTACEAICHAALLALGLATEEEL